MSADKSMLRQHIDELQRLSTILSKTPTDMHSGGFGIKYIADRKNYQILDVTTEKLEQMEPHTHTASNEWFILLSGRIEVTIEGVRRIYTPAKTCFVPMGKEHTVKPLTEDTHFIAILIPPEFAYKKLK